MSERCREKPCNGTECKELLGFVEANLMRADRVSGCPYPPVACPLSSPVHRAQEPQKMLDGPPRTLQSCGNHTGSSGFLTRKQLMLPLLTRHSLCPRDPISEAIGFFKRKTRALALQIPYLYWVTCSGSPRWSRAQGGAGSRVDHIAPCMLTLSFLY